MCTCHLHTGECSLHAVWTQYLLYTLPLTPTFLNMNIHTCCYFSHVVIFSTATPSSLAPVKSRMVHLSGSGLPRLSWKKGRYFFPFICDWLMRCWRGYLSRARFKWFAYSPADVTANPSSLASLKSSMVYLSGASLPERSWKRGL